MPVHLWAGFWVNVVHMNPAVFAYLVPAGQTAMPQGLSLIMVPTW